jgi:hypothetical protein
MARRKNGTPYLRAKGTIRAQQNQTVTQKAQRTELHIFYGKSPQKWNISRCYLITAPV